VLNLYTNIFLFRRRQDFTKQYFDQAILALKHKNRLKKLAKVSMDGFGEVRKSRKFPHTDGPYTNS